VSEVFHPEETSTAHYMTGIAQALAKVFPVRVLCVQPTYSRRGVEAPRHEVLDGVRILRCRSTTLDKNKLLLRLVNVLTITASIGLEALLRMRRGDVALVVTNPPVLPTVIQIVCLLRGAHCVVRIDDIYSEMMVASGLLRAESRKYRFMARCSRWLYRRAARIVVLGHDMKEFVSKRAEVSGESVRVIPNWSDCDDVKPAPREDNTLLRECGLLGKFVVQCAGNLGRVQAIESLVEAASQLRAHKHIHFLLIGGGTKKAWVEEQRMVRDLRNVTLLAPRPREQQNVFLNACDIGTTALVPGMWGAAVPSRLYNIMAAGKPVLVVGDRDSEAAAVVAGDKLGWVVPPERPDQIAHAIVEASKDPSLLHEMGQRARKVAETRYRAEIVTQAYVDLISELIGP
jgi:glycosyltransferase involved in cell wall biosynthesis